MKQQNLSSKKDKSLDSMNGDNLKSSVKNPEVNPRKAATKLKQANNNIEVMRRRFIVLQVQDDYNRYKTLDHEKRIQYHNAVHQRLSKDKQQLKISKDIIDDPTLLKEQTDKIRIQIREKLMQAKKHLIEQRTENSHQIKQQFHQHEQQIKSNKDQDYEERKSLKDFVSELQKRQKQLVNRYRFGKIESTRQNKSRDSSHMNQIVQDNEKELTKLMQYEQELLRKNNQSLQASHIMKSKFAQVYLSQRQRSSSSKLPDIRSKTNTNTSNHSNHSNHSELI